MSALKQLPPRRQKVHSILLGLVVAFAIALGFLHRWPQRASLMVSVSLLFDLLLLVLLAAAVGRCFRCPDCGKFLREGHHCDVIDFGCADSAILRLVPHADVTSLSYILESLTNRLTVEEAEAKHMVRDKRLGKKPVLFGFRHKNWQVLVSQMQSGDELWEYSFCVGPLHAEAGMAVIRNGEVVANLVTIRS